MTKRNNSLSNIASGILKDSIEYRFVKLVGFYFFSSFAVALLTSLFVYAIRGVFFDALFMFLFMYFSWQVALILAWLSGVVEWFFKQL